MKYWLAASLLLLGFGWLAYQGAGTNSLQSTAVEDELNLRVIEPVLTRYNIQGQIDSVLTAPDALDFGQSRPSKIDTPDIQWPNKQWTARQPRRSPRHHLASRRRIGTQRAPVAAIVCAFDYARRQFALGPRWTTASARLYRQCEAGHYQHRYTDYFAKRTSELSIMARTRFTLTALALGLFATASMPYPRTVICRCR